MLSVVGTQKKEKKMMCKYEVSNMSNNNYKCRLCDRFELNDFLI